MSKQPTKDAQRSKEFKINRALLRRQILPPISRTDRLTVTVEFVTDEEWALGERK